MKKSQLRHIIQKIISEQTTEFAHPMEVDMLVNFFKPQIETPSGDNRNKWRQFKGAIQHFVTGDPNANCGCNSFIPGPGDGNDNPGGGGGY